MPLKIAAGSVLLPRLLVVAVCSMVRLRVVSRLRV